MAYNNSPSQWASTTGLNLLTPTLHKDGRENPVIGRTFKARGKGFERGEARLNEFTITGINHIKSNHTFTVITARLGIGGEVEIPIHHGKRYLVPVNQR